MLIFVNINDILYCNIACKVGDIINVRMRGCHIQRYVVVNCMLLHCCAKRRVELANSCYRLACVICVHVSLCVAAFMANYSTVALLVPISIIASTVA